MAKEKIQSDKQKECFEEVARSLECDESDDALDKAMEGLNLEVDKEEKNEKNEKESPKD